MVRGYLRVVLFILRSFQKLSKSVISACVLATQVVNNQSVNHRSLRSALVFGSTNQQLFGCRSDTNKYRYVFGFHADIVMLSLCNHSISENTYMNVLSELC